MTPEQFNQGLQTLGQAQAVAPAPTPRKYAEITHRSGIGLSGRIYFRMQSHEEITKAEAESAQTRLGYNPMGYGIFNFVIDRVDGLYVAHWSCSTSCG